MENNTKMHQDRQSDTSMDNKIIIQFHDVSKIYRIGGEEVKALNHASFSITRGEFVSIVGPSGSGKSTIMNIMGCLDMADEGEYRLDDQSITEYSEKELSKIRNRKIGFIFQNFNLISKMTAEENIELPLIYQRVASSERKKRVHDALCRVELSERKKHKPTELSGGQQQRVAIARAIVTNPSLILADEPTGNLDSKTGAEIIRLFHELHESGNTIVLITHDDKIAKQAKRSIHINDGQAWEVNE